MPHADPTREAGRVEGALLSQRATLRKQLAIKFGELEPSDDAVVEDAGSEALDRYLERILTADAIDDVLHPPEDADPDGDNPPNSYAEQLRQQARVGAVRELLTEKFGDLGPGHDATLENSTHRDLDRCLERILTVGSADEALGRER